MNESCLPAPPLSRSLTGQPLAGVALTGWFQRRGHRAEHAADAAGYRRVTVDSVTELVRDKSGTGPFLR